MDLTTTFSSTKVLSIYASALDSLTFMFEASGSIYLMDIVGFSSTATNNASSVSLSASYTEGMIINPDSAFYIDFDTTSVKGMVTDFYDGSQNCDSHTLTTQTFTLSYSSISPLTGLTLTSSTAAYAFNGEIHSQNNITSIAPTSILGFCSSPYTVLAAVSPSTATSSFFIDGTSNFTFSSSTYFSGGVGCSDITITYTVSDPSSAFSGGLYVSSAGVVSVGPTYQTDGTHIIDVIYTLSDGSSATLTLSVTFTSCATATFSSFTTIPN